MLFSYVDRKIREDVQIEIYKQHTRQSKKLEHLKQQRKPISKNTTLSHIDSHIFHQRVMNCTDVIFPQHHLVLLNKGLKYSPNIVNLSSYENLAIKLDTILDNQDKIHFSKILQKDISKFKQSKNKIYKDKNTIKEIKDLVKEKDLIICKAD